MAAIRLGGMAFRPRRLMARAAGRWGAMSAGGVREAWMNMRGPMGSAAFKGAAIGAGLNAGASLIGDATNGDFNGRSVGRAIGAGLRGGLMGGAAGAAWHTGNFFLGRSPMVGTRAARMAASRPGRMGMTGMRGGMGGGVNMMSGMGRRGGDGVIMGSGRMRSSMRYTGTGFATQTPTFSRWGAAAGRGFRNWGRARNRVGNVGADWRSAWRAGT